MHLCAVYCIFFRSNNNLTLNLDFYQWLRFLLLGLSFLSWLPHCFVNYGQDNKTLIDQIGKSPKEIAKFMLDYGTSQWYLFVKYVLLEIVIFLGTCGQLYYTNWFLNGNFVSFGLGK